MLTTTSFPGRAVRLPWPIALCLLALLLLAVPAPAPASETDQFLALETELANARAPLNDFINGAVEEVIEEYNARPGRQNYYCKTLANDIMWKFRMVFVHRVELWADEHLDVYPPLSVSNDEYRASSIYHRDLPMDLQKLIPLSRTIRIDQTLVGIDKLGHFVSLGHRYATRYRQQLSAGLSPEQALEDVLEWGYQQERGMIGRQVSGVLSLADLEANYQGMQFVRSLCDDKPARLNVEGTQWVLQRPVDIAEYVNPDWDESLNISAYSDKRWAEVAPRLRQYCGALDPDGRLPRRYANPDFDTSVASRWLQDKLAIEGVAPATLRNACPADRRLAAEPAADSPSTAAFSTGAP